MRRNPGWSYLPRDVEAFLSSRIDQQCGCGNGYIRGMHRKVGNELASVRGVAYEYWARLVGLTDTRGGIKETKERGRKSFLLKQYRATRLEVMSIHAGGHCQ